MFALRVLFAVTLVVCVLGDEELPPSADEGIDYCLEASCQPLDCLKDLETFVEEGEGKERLVTLIEDVQTDKFDCAGLMAESSETCYLRSLFEQTNKLVKEDSSEVCMNVRGIKRAVSDLIEICPKQKTITEKELKEINDIEQACLEEERID